MKEVSDHAVLRYLERIVGLDIEGLRADIGQACQRSAGAPCVRIGQARYIVRGSTVVTVLDGRALPAWEFLAIVTRINGHLSAESEDTL